MLISKLLLNQDPIYSSDLFSSKIYVGFRVGLRFVSVGELLGVNEVLPIGCLRLTRADVSY